MSTFLAAFAGSCLAYLCLAAVVVRRHRADQKAAAAGGPTPIAGTLALRCSKCGHGAAYVRSEVTEAGTVQRLLAEKRVLQAAYEQVRSEMLAEMDLRQKTQAALAALKEGRA